MRRHVPPVEAAEFLDTLKGEGPITEVAPTDEAFAKLPAGTVEDLLKPKNQALARRALHRLMAGMAGQR